MSRRVMEPCWGGWMSIMGPRCDCGLLDGVLIVFEAFLIHAHHSLVGAGLAGEDALLVDIGPTQTEAETLDGGASVGGDLSETFGLFGGEGPNGGAGGGCCAARAFGEAELHGADGAAGVIEVLAAICEQIVVMRKTGIHAGLLDGKKADEAWLFGGGPDGFGGSEVALAGGADGTGNAGREAESDTNAALLQCGCIDSAHGLFEPGFKILQAEVPGDDGAIVFSFCAEVGLQLLTLTGVMDQLDGLLESDSNENADDDDEEMDEGVPECDAAVLRRVDVNHGCTCERIILVM